MRHWSGMLGKSGGWEDKYQILNPKFQMGKGSGSIVWDLRFGAYDLLNL
jgi:hypothetical protein